MIDANKICKNRACKQAHLHKTYGVPKETWPLMAHKIYFLNIFNYCDLWEEYFDKEPF